MTFQETNSTYYLSLQEIQKLVNGEDIPLDSGESIAMDSDAFNIICGTFIQLHKFLDSVPKSRREEFISFAEAEKV